MDCNKVNIKQGSKGNDVKELQQYLKFLGLYTAEIDSQCGSKTVIAIKKLQKLYGNSQDGVFGKKTCSKCGINGQSIDNTIQKIDTNTFKDMIKRYDTYCKNHKNEPKICYIDINTKYRYVSNAKFKDMRKRYEEFIKKNGREPDGCYVNKPVASINTVTTDIPRTTSFLAKMRDAVGNFTTFKEWYNLIKGRGYIGYNNDIYNQETAIKRLKNKQGLNCSDICQLGYQVAVDLDVQVRYVHVKCKSGIGHIQLDVKYPRGSSHWTRIDPAAALSTGSKYSFGKLWCANGKLLSYNDAWLMTDDGRT